MCNGSLQHVTYRLLALDLDGTVMDDHLSIRPSVHDAIARSQEAGVRVVLATGRGYDATLPYAQKLGISEPLICYQGGQIRDPSNGRVLHETTFERALALELIAWKASRERLVSSEASPGHNSAGAKARAMFDQGGIDIAMFMDGVMYLDRTDGDPEFFERYFGQRVRFVADLRASLYTAPHKSMLIAHPVTCDEILPELRARFAGHLQVVRSHPLFVEVTPPDVSKGRGLAILAEHLGIPQAATIAVGDNENDLSMIEWAGVGVAMGNATPQLKAAAGWIAPGIDEDGVAAVVSRFILG
jgi:hydroxymethylpyrimidine pyrophosphatase-like HAD family hydrolase